MITIHWAIKMQQEAIYAKWRDVKETAKSDPNYRIDLEKSMKLKESYDFGDFEALMIDKTLASEIELYSGYNNMLKESLDLTQSEPSHSKMLVSSVISNKIPQSMSIVGKSEQSVEKYIKMFREPCYENGLLHNELSVETATNRAFKRWYDSGKYIPMDYFYDLVAKNLKNFYNEVRKKGSVDAYEHKSNDVDYGSEPRVIETHGKQELFSTNRESGYEYARQREAGYAKLPNQIPNDTPSRSDIHSDSRLTKVKERLKGIKDNSQSSLKKPTLTKEQTTIKDKIFDILPMDDFVDNGIMAEINDAKLVEVLNKFDKDIKNIDNLNLVERNQLIETIANELFDCDISEKGYSLYSNIY